MAASRRCKHSRMAVTREAVKMFPHDEFSSGSLAEFIRRTPARDFPREVGGSRNSKARWALPATVAYQLRVLKSEGLVTNHEKVGWRRIKR